MKRDTLCGSRACSRSSSSSRSGLSPEFFSPMPHHQGTDPRFVPASKKGARRSGPIKSTEKSVGVRTEFSVEAVNDGLVPLLGVMVETAVYRHLEALIPGRLEGL